MRAGSFGLSCSTTIHAAPASRQARHRSRQSSTPEPTSAQPSSSSFCPAGAMSFTWAETTRLRYRFSHSFGSAPPRTSQATSACQVSGLPSAASKISSSAVLPPSLGFSSQ